MKDEPAFDLYSISSLRDLLDEVSRRYSEKPALQSKREGRYLPFYYRDLIPHVEALGAAFADLGLKGGDRIALLGENRSEWALSYLASVYNGFVVVPIDKDLTPREVHHLLGVSGARLVLATASYLEGLVETREALRDLKFIVSMEAEPGAAGMSFPQILKRGSELIGERPTAPETAVGPEDLAAIIFTSGTTGAAKGVMLTHGNLAANVMDTSYHVGIDHDDVLLSVLPLHHAYECTAGFLTALYQGACICYAESLRRIPDNLTETQATVMLGVPALFESMYRRIQAGVKQAGPWKFQLARTLAAFSQSVLRVNARRRLFRKLHDRFGGRLRLMISGGAAIDPEIARGFRELGIDFIQGYGLTEHSPIISVNRVDHFKDASVGLPLPSTEVRITNGEITVRGPSVMKGYYQNRSATEETLAGGWLLTGDLGYLDSDGFLFINGRRKSVIVTPNGKNVYPEELEFLLNQSRFVLESLVWGGPDEDPSQVEVQAILVPDTAAFDEEFGPAGWDEQQMSEILDAELKKINRDLANFKRIRKFSIRGEEFEKTTTRKIKRYLYTGKKLSVEAAHNEKADS